MNSGRCIRVNELGNQLRSTRNIGGNLAAAVICALAAVFPLFGAFFFFAVYPEQAGSVNQFGQHVPLSKTDPMQSLVWLLIGWLFFLAAIILIWMMIRSIRSVLYYLAMYQNGIKGRAKNGLSFSYPYEAISYVDAGKKGLTFIAASNRYIIPLSKRTAQFFKTSILEQLSARNGMPMPPRMPY